MNQPGPVAIQPAVSEQNIRTRGRVLVVLGGVVLAVLPAPFYVSVALRMDRFEPEPFRLLAWTFLWGAAGATFVALVLNTAGQAIVGDEFGAHIGELYGNSVSAPIVEEVAKGAVLYVLYRRFRAHFNSVVDGVVYAAMVGLGFATTENILYYAQSATEGGVPLVATFFMRGVMSPFTHPIFTAMTGIGLALALASDRAAVKRLAPALGLLLAILLHSAWNTSATVEEGAGFFFVFSLVFVVAVAVLAAVGTAQKREGKVVAHYLQPEMASGLLTREELFALSSGRERMRARRAAKKQGGRKAMRRMKTLQIAASELAFRRYRDQAGHPGRGPETPEDQQLAKLREAAGDIPAGTLAPPIPRGSEKLPPPPPVMPAGWYPEPPRGVEAVTGPSAKAPPAPPPPRPVMPGLPPAAWYPDPWRESNLRWWDGGAWTGWTS
ncbi:MAG: PrsW family intramembrane metalloprotease [Thermoleophilaceae bacterium]|nr:PrsW family intramembrane metalloprotease [Thermoleophilaceae bacterium]